MTKIRCLLMLLGVLLSIPCLGVPQKSSPEVPPNPNNLELVHEGTNTLFPVVVIDSGIDYTHSDIAPFIHINATVTPLTLHSFNITNDIYGWDFNENDSKAFDNKSNYVPRFVSNELPINSDSFLDRLAHAGGLILNNAAELIRLIISQGTPGHGTHVSGIVITSCEMNCSIVPLKVFGDKDLSIESLVAAVEYSKARGYRLINMSLGLYMKYLKNMNEEQQNFILNFKKVIEENPEILFVVAAGNDGFKLAPGDKEIIPAMLKLPNLITVGAVDSQGKLADFSNYSDEFVDVYAPGVDIESTWNDGTYKVLSGTSMATPYVSGVIGKLWSERPSLHSFEIKDYFLTRVRMRTLLFPTDDLNPRQSVQARVLLKTDIL